MILHDLINHSPNQNYDTEKLIQKLEHFRHQTFAIVYSKRFGTPDIHRKLGKDHQVTKYYFIPQNCSSSILLSILFEHVRYLGKLIETWIIIEKHFPRREKKPTKIYLNRSFMFEYVLL